MATTNGENAFAAKITNTEGLKEQESQFWTLQERVIKTGTMTKKGGGGSRREINDGGACDRPHFPTA